MDLLYRAGELIAAVDPDDHAGLDERSGDLLDVERISAGGAWTPKALRVRVTLSCSLS
jgi:hypothetical protein